MEECFTTTAGKGRRNARGKTFAALVVAVCAAAFAGPNGDRPDSRHAWAVHDENRPNPPQVHCEAGEVPSDAILLFDGTEASIARHWRSQDGSPAKWISKDGLFYCVPKSGMVYAKDEAADFQLHVEFMIPDPPGPGLGNSGVYVHGKYELQILHSYHNMDAYSPAPPWKNGNYADGEIGALYGQNPPLVTACRKAGNWQVYDVVFHPSRWEGDSCVEPARVTAFLNGLLVQDNAPLDGPTWYVRRSAHDRKMEKETDCVVALQDHGHPVAFRNVWYRPIPSRRANAVGGGDVFDPVAAEALRAKLAAKTLAKAHSAAADGNRLVWLWESYAYRPDAAVKREIEAQSAKYVQRLGSLRGALMPADEMELKNMSGFVAMGIRCGLFKESDALPKAVNDALSRTRKTYHFKAPLRDATAFAALGENFPKAIAFLERTDISTLAPGKYPIDGDKCWATIQETDIAPPGAEVTYEAHRRYADIQMPISGDEIIGVMDTPDSAGDYNEKGDFLLFKAKGRLETYKPGEFAIFMPGKGAHAPGLSPAGKRRHRKLVVKVLCE